MSYSIGVVAINIQAAREALAAKFDEQVLKSQPVHAKDRDQALAAADAFLALLGPQPENHDVTINLNGSLGWSGSRPMEEVIADGGFTWVNLGVSGGYSFRKAATVEAKPTV